MTTASVSPAAGATSDDAPASTADPLTRLGLVLDRELIGVRRHDLELAGRVPESVRPHVDASAGMLEFLVDDGSGGVVVLALAPGARGDTVVPLLPAVQPTEPGGHDVSAAAPFDEVVGEAIEDVSRLLTHVEAPDEMRGLVLHLGGQMLMVYADLWELRVTLLP
ncbi:hypothetical protein [Actinomycetospora sp. NBC_00405]|uniref:hypothetical protein n=1 Tax=Actinomycetospora sp. NBC_00405 TaxID=2975952 RepID=UPI002E2000F5